MYKSRVSIRCCLFLTGLASVYLIMLHTRHPKQQSSQLSIDMRNNIESQDMMKFNNFQRFRGAINATRNAHVESNSALSKHGMKRSLAAETGTALTNQKDNRTACKLPRIDPYHELAMREMEFLDPLNCPKNNIASVADGSLTVDGKMIGYLHLQYVRRPMADDFGVQFSDPVLLTEYSTQQIEIGKFGCLVANGNEVLKFDGNDHVTVADGCTSGSVFEILPEGRIRHLEEKCIGMEDDCTERCPLVLTLSCDDENTKFEFESDGAVRHKSSGMCVKMVHDDYNEFTELLLSRDCSTNHTKWHMFAFEETDLKMKIALSEDFTRLVAIKDRKWHVEYHASVIPQRSRYDATDNGTARPDLYNIMLIMLESQSSANVVRKMPKTFEYLQGDRNTVMFDGHTIVGEGTTDQLCAILVDELEENLPEAKKDAMESGYVDRWPFIFNRFRDNGYVTLFSEDDYRYAAFNYRLNGFKNPPTDHYARFFWHAAEREDGRPNTQCIGDKLYHQLNFDYTESFMDGYRDSPRMGISVASFLAHNNMNNIQHVDDDLVAFMKSMREKGHLENTFVFLVGDHGLRASSFRDSFEGWLEERLPFFSFTFPDRFLAKYPDYKNIVKQNTQTLTSHFDIYATLAHILSYPTAPTGTTGQSLLTLIDRENRTCKSAGVKDQWCPCQTYVPTDPKEPSALLMGQSVVKLINRINSQVPEAELACAHLELDTVKKIAVKKAVVKEASSGRKNDQFIEMLQDNIMPENTIAGMYRITLSVEPSKAIYEAVVLYSEEDAELLVNPEISRLNLYGDQPICIMEKHPRVDN